MIGKFGLKKFHAQCIPTDSSLLWVGGQVQGILAGPDILYKYVPCTRLEDGCLLTLRAATQPSALNDVMEGKIKDVNGIQDGPG